MSYDMDLRGPAGCGKVPDLLQKVLALTGDVVASPATRQNMMPTPNPLLDSADRLHANQPRAGA